MEAGPLGYPVADSGGLVGAVVVEDQMNLQSGGYVLFDGVEELTKLDASMAPATRAICGALTNRDSMTCTQR